MELKSYFDTFLTNIRPTTEEKENYQKGHTELQELLQEDAKIKPLLVTTFLQGSYRRHTAIKAAGTQRSDVDVVVVTKISPKDSPKKALEYFEPFCEEHYSGKWNKKNDRSIAIELEEVSLDLVVTAAPSESEEGLLKNEEWVKAEFLPSRINEARLVKSWVADGGHSNLSYTNLLKFSESSSETGWKTNPLLIPDRKFENWNPTHPLAQIEWTWAKNLNTDNHYINIVKAIKWWKRIHATSMPKYPKGYPLEHLIGAACPNKKFDSLALGITEVFEVIAHDYTVKPYLADHGVPSHDVMKRVSALEYAQFHAKIREAAVIARSAYNEKDSIEKSAALWQKLFGNEFPTPEPDDTGSKGGFTDRNKVSTVSSTGRYA